MTAIALAHLPEKRISTARMVGGSACRSWSCGNPWVTYNFIQATDTGFYHYPVSYRPGRHD